MLDNRKTLYPETSFGEFSDIDFAVTFFNRVNALIDPTSIVLDFGCGRGVHENDPSKYRRDIQILKGKVQRVIGVDVDEEASSNPYIDEFHLLASTSLPLEDASVDICISRSVVEHLEDPAAFFEEMKRVIRPGGYLCIVTPNKRSYFGIASRLIPNSIHSTVLKRVMPSSFRDDEDVFPTLYRCNTINEMKKILTQNEFAEHVVYGYEGEPQYLSFSSLAYRIGILHQKVAPHFIKPVMFVFAKRGTSA